MFNAYRLPEGLVSDVYQVAMSYKWYYSSLVESWHGFVDDISFVCNTRVIRHRWNCQSLMPKWRHEPWAHYVIPYTPWFSVIVMGAWYTVISLLWNATLFCIPRSLTCSPPVIIFLVNWIVSIGQIICNNQENISLLYLPITGNTSWVKVNKWIHKS